MKQLVYSKNNKTVYSKIVWLNGLVLLVHEVLLLQHLFHKQIFQLRLCNYCHKEYTLETRRLFQTELHSLLQYFIIQQTLLLIKICMKFLQIYLDTHTYYNFLYFLLCIHLVYNQYNLHWIKTPLDRKELCNPYHFYP